MRFVHSAARFLAHSGGYAFTVIDIARRRRTMRGNGMAATVVMCVVCAPSNRTQRRTVRVRPCARDRRTRSLITVTCKISALNFAFESVRRRYSLDNVFMSVRFAVPKYVMFNYGIGEWSKEFNNIIT